MADDLTQQLNGGTLEQRIMARFDAMDARFNAVEARLSAFEEQAEEQKRETRPLWEKALADIAGIAADTKEVKSDITIMIQDMHKVRAKQFDLELRVREIETTHTQN